MNSTRTSTAQNPIHETPAIFTIFGITGDLRRKRSSPPCGILRREGRLPKRLSIIGFARRTLSDIDFKTMVREAVEKVAKASVPDPEFDEFFKMFTYRNGTFETKEGFVPLMSHVEEMENASGAYARTNFSILPSLRPRTNRSLNGSPKACSISPAMMIWVGVASSSRNRSVTIRDERARSGASTRTIFQRGSDLSH